VKDTSQNLHLMSYKWSLYFVQYSHYRNTLDASQSFVTRNKSFQSISLIIQGKQLKNKQTASICLP